MNSFRSINLSNRFLVQFTHALIIYGTQLTVIWLSYKFFCFIIQGSDKFNHPRMKFRLAKKNLGQKQS